MERVRHMKTRAQGWFGARKYGSTDSLTSKPPLETPILSRRPDSKTQFELTSLRVCHCLEKQRYTKVVEMLREYSHDFVLRCLESFPFKDLNRALPETFPIWETLLAKLHNSEDGYIPQFPYAACDELIVQTAWLLQEQQDEPIPSPAGSALFLSCKRVLKRVYMQYNDALQQLFCEHHRAERCLYTLGLHLPLGSDATAVSLQQAILSEVQACLVDYHDSIDRLDELLQNERASAEDGKGEGLPGGGALNCSKAPNPSQKQLQERLYVNQCVLTSLQPSRRRGNLGELLELLNERIKGDKEVLALFGSIRQRHEGISDRDPVEPWLRKHQRAVEGAIALMKEIESELMITHPRTSSPCDATPPNETQLSTPTDDGPTIFPVCSFSLDEGHSSATRRRYSAAVLDEYLMEEEVGKARLLLPKRELSLPSRRPRSTSPHKIYRTNAPVSGNIKSTIGSTGNLTVNGIDSSSHELQAFREMQPAFNLSLRHSLKKPSPVVAGKKSSAILPSSFTNLSISTGNMSKSLKSKMMIRTSSGGLMPVNSWDRTSGDYSSANQFMLQQELEFKSKELQQARERIQELIRRERELTNRLSEQAQRQLRDSEKFEDILLGASRPTMVVQRYQELYCQERVEAIEAIEALKLGGATFSFVMQLALDVLKYAHSAAERARNRLTENWKRALGVEEEATEGDEGGKLATRELESSVGLYLRRVCPSHDITDIIQETKRLLSDKYSADVAYSKMRQLEPFASYVTECARLAWDLVIQCPPMLVDYTEGEFSPDRHSHFYNSNKTSPEIVMHLWPVLIQASGPVLVRGIVIT